MEIGFQVPEMVYQKCTKTALTYDASLCKQSLVNGGSIRPRVAVGRLTPVSMNSVSPSQFSDNES
jgi:hypothetical protein